MTGALAGHYAKALADAVFGPNSGLTPEDAVMRNARRGNVDLRIGSCNGARFAGG